DFSGTEEMEKRRRENAHVNPFHHDPNLETNQNLVEFLRPFYQVEIEGKNAGRCGVVFGNIIWPIKEGKVTARLRKWKRAIRASEPIFRATVQAMANLKIILCLGQIPYEGLSTLEDQNRNWRRDLTNHQCFRLRDRNEVVVCPLPHTGKLGLLNRSDGK